MEFDAPDEAELGYEDALSLLDELHDAVDELEEEGDEADPGERERARDLVDRLLDSFGDLPVTSKLVEEHLERVESWARVLLSDEEETEEAGSICQLLREELLELRGYLEYELAT